MKPITPGGFARTQFRRDHPGTLRLPNGKTMPTHIVLHRMGWWIATSRDGSKYRAYAWRHGNKDVKEIYDVTERDALARLVKDIQRGRHRSREYWAARARLYGVKPKCLDAWVQQSALYARPAPTIGVEAIGTFLVVTDSASDIGDGITAYRDACRPIKDGGRILVAKDTTPELCLDDWHINYFRERLRKVRLSVPSELRASPIIGWRVWKIRRGKLTSPQQKTVWPIGCALEAHNGRARVKHVDRDAGIYARKTRADDIDDDLVEGQVALWGDVLECEDGWIAQYAYPYALPQPWAKLYGCDVLPGP
jgi:hypothetical protein